jgi:uncharacterized protein (TIGR01370 family)
MKAKTSMRRERHGGVRRYIALLGLLFAGKLSAALPAVALYYATDVPWDELAAFDVVVVDPAAAIDPRIHTRADSAVFAYVSIGEVDSRRPYFAAMPKQWLKGSDPDWHSARIDQSAADWPRFFADRIIAPLWDKGYTGFFIDNVDAYRQFTATDADRRRQEAGLIAAITEVHKRWPGARLILNRGFEILPAVHDSIWMLAAESLYQGWDGGTRRYIEVSEKDRAWLRAQLAQAQSHYRLPVLVIDYVPLRDRALARRTAARIRSDGFIPWVTTGDLDSLGVGGLEVLPRKVLVLYDPRNASDLQYLDVQRFLGMAFAYLGLIADYRPIDSALPEGAIADRYAGIVVWVDDDSSVDSPRYVDWLLQAIDQGAHVAVFNSFGAARQSRLWRALGLVADDELSTAPLSIVNVDPMMGFELPVRPRAAGLEPVRLTGAGRALLTLRSADGRVYHPAALTPWGGYALAPFTVDSLTAEARERWYLNPLRFLSSALVLPADAPVPDVTTESGRRMLMVHIDGDGFASRVEGAPDRFAGEALYDDFLKRYRLPTTASVIEGEVGPAGLYPKDSPRLEAAARRIFALPWVEVASHSYSHPLNWGLVQEAQDNSEDYHLPIPGYTYSVDREISGSLDYINHRLLPADKRVRVFLWTGNCVATPEALRAVARSGVLNMNGGETLITDTSPSWTKISGLGIPRAGYFQVFAPNQNENLYTNLWHGPFYGFQRVIETFRLTETPYRFKPVDIYYHYYSATKSASREALHRVYQWALAQSLTPVFVTEYLLKVDDFNRMTIARYIEGGYRIRGNGALRSLRLPQAGPPPDWSGSRDVVGVAPGPSARYVTLGGGSAELRFAAAASRQPYLVSANARVEAFSRGEGMLRMDLRGHVPLQLTVANAQGCRVTAPAAARIVAKRTDTLTDFRIPDHDHITFELQCPAV